jgi:hypothetical protein
MGGQAGASAEDRSPPKGGGRIDIRPSGRSLDPGDASRLPLETLGDRLAAANRDRTGALVLGRQSAPWMTIHIREAGSWSEQFQLLFRDDPRGHRDEVEGDAALKRRPAGQYPDDVDADAKGDVVWSVMRRAHHRSMRSGRSPGASDD